MGTRSVTGILGYKRMSGHSVGGSLKENIETMVRCHIFYLKDNAL